jgi:hypothetical protein
MGDGSVGSLQLGLYDDGGRLQHVGVCASFIDGHPAYASAIGELKQAGVLAGPAGADHRNT